jgi:hypothetical protein
MAYELATVVLEIEMLDDTRFQFRRLPRRDDNPERRLTTPEDGGRLEIDFFFAQSGKTLCECVLCPTGMEAWDMIVGGQ